VPDFLLSGKSDCFACGSAFPVGDAGLLLPVKIFYLPVDFDRIAAVIILVSVIGDLNLLSPLVNFKVDSVGLFSDVVG